jgi:glycosyltransferase involved in cell wall biosynthesis
MGWPKVEFPIPILLMSDAPDQHSGLARITRDLASILCGQPEWRVGTYGWLGTGSSRLPWTQYHIRGGWGEADFPAVWDEFSQGKPGVVLSVWDLHRIVWLARPDMLTEGELRKWLTDARAHRMRLWSYIPIDATGPGDRLTAMARETLLGIDRILAYSPWAADVVRRTIGDAEADKRGVSWMPHGLGDTWTPASSPTMAISDNEYSTNSTVSDVPSTIPVDLEPQEGGGSHAGGPVIGVVATNQARKDFGLWAAVAAGLRQVRPDVRWWVHTDAILRHWNLAALIEDFRLHDIVEVTLPQLTDAEMAERYRKCSLTLAVAPEGFGYPIFESIACGVPCLHVSYAGGASIMKTCGLEQALVSPETMRLEGEHNYLRPVHSPELWVEYILDLLEQLPLEDGMLTGRVDHLRWSKLKWPWRRWFRDGIGEVA